MLGELFQKVLDMSLIGCYSILIVMAVRLLLSRFERKFTYYLWFVVFLNLCIPISFQGIFSLIPDFVAEFSVSDAVEDVLGTRGQGGSDAVIIPTLPDGAQGIDSNYNFALGNPGGAGYPSQALEEETAPLAIKITSGVWLVGIAVLLIWSLAGMLRLKKKISRDNWISFNKKQRIAEVAELDTPFLWGIFKPTIYLPTDLESEEMRYIVAHEQYHKKRKDYLIKIAVFLVTAIHWFNPLVWIAYTLFCRDMEISCDEAVLLEFKDNIRKQYAGSLLKYAARQSGFVLSPITFGEPAVKTRIKNVLRFKKRGIVISVLTVICVAGVAAGLVLRPFAEEKIPQEASGQNTAESELLNMSAGVDEMLTNDTSDLTAATEETQEGSDTTVLTVMKEGMPEEIPATLYKGEGYSIYVADGVWDNYEPDAWQAEKNNQVHFGVGHYEGMNKSQVEKTLTEQGYVAENGELWMQESDIMYRTICYEAGSGTWTVNFAYPWGEAEEGWLPVMRAMADTFTVDAGYDVGAHTEIHEQDIELSEQDSELINMAIHDNEHNIYTGNIGNEEIRMMITRTEDSLYAEYTTRSGEGKVFHGNLANNVAGFVLNTDDGEYLNGIITETDDGYFIISGEGVLSQSNVTFTLNQESFIALGDDMENYYDFFGYNADEAERFVQQIKDSINDKAAFARLIQYPISIEMDNGNGMALIENEEDMIAVYDQLMEEIGIKEQIENIYTKFMFANYTGICVDDGIMWITIDSSGDYKITAINPPSYYITELYAD